MEVAYRELTLGIAALFNDPVTGRGGLPALDRLLHLGQYALGVPGMALSELHDSGGAGRVIAATGSADWALGRPVQPEVVTAVLRPGPATYRVELDAIDDAEPIGFGLADYLEQHLIRVRAIYPIPDRVWAALQARAEADGHTLLLTTIGTGAINFAVYGDKMPYKPADLAASAQDLFAAVQSGAVKIRVNQTFPLSDAKSAHEALEARRTTGSTVLIP